MVLFIEEGRDLSMQKNALSAMLCMAILLGVLCAWVPAGIAAEDNNEVQGFENIDYEKSTDIRVVIDGKQVMFDVPPQLVNSRLMVPMRTIFEEFGLTLYWDGTTNTATGTGSEVEISIAIGSYKALVNGEEQTLDVPARLINDKTMLPLRFLSQNMNYRIVWISSSNLILLSKADITEWRYAGFEETEPYKEYERKYINGFITDETRYTGKNHPVQIVTLYDARGRLVQNVQDFKINQYGTGWSRQSAFTGKTYWVDLDAVSGPNGLSRFYDTDGYLPIETSSLRASAPAGNYLKVKIEDHYFELATWQQLVNSPNSTIYNVQDAKAIAGQVIENNDALFKVTINDRQSGLIAPAALLGALLQPDNKHTYTILTKDPRQTYDWSDSIWNKLKGETPWIGMTGDMLLVQKQADPDKTAQVTTKFSVLELWVYTGEFSDSIYCLDDGVLTSMW